MRPEVLESLDRIARPARGSRRSLGPHAIYTVSEESLRWIAEVAAEREIPLQIHLSETEQEVERLPASPRQAPGRLPRSTSASSASARVLAHGVWLDRGELELIAERGATVVTNPVANMKLAVGGVLPYPARPRPPASRSGSGTDGVSSNSNLDLFEEVKLFALSQKHASGDPATLPAAEALAIARGLRSPVLGWDGARGRAARRLPAAPRLGPRALGRRPRLPTSSTRPGARSSTPP